MRNEESPTRKGVHADVDALSADMMRVMTFDDDEASEAEDLSDDSDIGHDDEINEESEDESEDECQDKCQDECDEVGPVKEPTHCSLNHGNMIFSARKPAPLPMKGILDCMGKASTDLASGYIYCFPDKSAPGYLKIGSTKSKKIQEATEEPPSSKNKDDKNFTMLKRIQEWKRKCKHDIEYKFILFMPYAVRRMESLIHRTLHKEQRDTICRAQKCKAKHREWFEIPEDEAEHVAKVWYEFSELEPYDREGRLKEDWRSYASSPRNEDASVTTRDWLETECVVALEEIGTQIKKRRKRVLEGHLEKTQERKRVADCMLSKAKKDEGRILKELRALEAAGY
ncbi:hypothetical protein ACHAPU_003919 [Fusarium lateritium]